MSEVKWTKEQRQVIESRNTNLLVSAAAGSGKTAVLIERIIELVLDEKNPIDINKLLVVTFTKLAASEMRERVSKAIEKKLEENPENEHLQKQLLLLSGADITTIDSFCKDVLISYAHLVNLDSNIKVIDPSENEVLAKEVMQELFEELYENNDESFLRLVDWYAKKNTDEGLLQLLLNVNNFVNSHPFPNIWLNEKAEFFNTMTKDDDFYLENYILDIAKDVDMDLEFFELSIKNNLKKIENYPELEKYVNMYNDLLDALSVVKENLKKFLKDNTKFDELKISTNEFLNSNFGSFRISKCDEEVKEIYNKVKKELDSIKLEITESLGALNLDLENIKKGHLSISEQTKLQSMFQKVCDKVEKSNTEDLFLVRDVLFAGLGSCELLNNLELFKLAVEKLNWIAEKTRDFQKQPIVLMLEWKYYIQTDYETAKHKYEEAKMMARMFGNEKLIVSLDNEWAEDLERYR